ncbi:hypothetical protein [Streptococcus equi]
MAMVADWQQRLQRGFVRSFFDVTGFSCVGLGDLKPYDGDNKY